MNNALYIGSFDMFTNGHLDIIEQSINLFDKIYVVIANNPLKKRRFNIYIMKNIMEYVFSKKEYCNKIYLDITDELSIRYAEKNNCNYLIRGIRNNTDYNYEENLSIINNELNNNITTLYFRTKYPHISSTFVDEMYKHGENIEKYLPYNFNELRRE